MNLVERIAAVEKRLSEIELALPRSSMRGRAVEKWIIETLTRTQGRRIHGAIVPKRCETVAVIMEQARKAGIAPHVLRAARIGIENRVEVVHVPGSKRWMWRLLY